MCPLLSWEKVGIENKEYEKFKYLFSLIFDEKVWQNKYLGGICWVIKQVISTNGEECSFVNLGMRFVMTMDEV